MPKKKTTTDIVIRSFIGRRIRERRIKLGITGESLSRRIGHTRASVSGIEMGKQSVNSETLFQIMTILNCTADELFPPRTDLSDCPDPDTNR